MEESSADREDRRAVFVRLLETAQDLSPEQLANPLLQQDRRDFIRGAGWHSQAEMGRDLFLTDAVISRWVNGRRAPTDNHLHRLDQILANRCPETYRPEELLRLWRRLPEAPGGDRAVGHRPADEPDASTHRARWLGASVIGVLLVTAVAIGGYALVWGDDERESVAPNGSGLTISTLDDPEPCRVQVGSTEDSELALHTDSMVAAYDEAGGPEALGCPSEPVGRWGPGVRQLLTDTGGNEAAILVADEGPVMVLSGPSWQSFTEQGGRDRDEVAPELQGYPLERELDDDGRQLIELAEGGLQVGELVDAPHFWVPSSVRSMWEEHGGLDGSLGLPRSNVYAAAGGWRQDFTGGVVLLDQSGGIVLDPESLAEAKALPLRVEMVDDPGAVLGDLEALKGGIIRQSDGTAWFIGEDGTRRWIRDGGTWGCLGGDANLAVGADGEPLTETPGYAITVFTWGGKASC